MAKDGADVSDLETLRREVSGAGKKIDFAEVMRAAEAEFDELAAQRAARSEEEVRRDIFNYVGALIDANLRDNDRAFKALAHTVSTIMIDDETYLHISLDGTEFEDAECFVAEKDGKVYKFGENLSRVEVEDQFIVQQAQILVAQYRAGEEGCNRRREKLAVDAAKGDELLGRVMRMSIDYSGGSLPTPSHKEGIDFYAVGHNASHAFYLGVKDGKMYRMSIGEDSYETLKPEDPNYLSKEQLLEEGMISGEDLPDEERLAAIVAHYNTQPVYGETITELKPGESTYLGHY